MENNRLKVTRAIRDEVVQRLERKIAALQRNIQTYSEGDWKSLMGYNLNYKIEYMKGKLYKLESTIDKITNAFKGKEFIYIDDIVRLVDTVTGNESYLETRETMIGYYDVPWRYADNAEQAYDMGYVRQNYEIMDYLKEM